MCQPMGNLTENLNLGKSLPADRPPVIVKQHK